MERPVMERSGVERSAMEGIRGANPAEVISAAFCELRRSLRQEGKRLRRGFNGTAEAVPLKTEAQRGCLWQESADFLTPGSILGPIPLCGFAAFGWGWDGDRGFPYLPAPSSYGTPGSSLA